jgi:hypothetical protein
VNIVDKKEAAKIKTRVAWYNMIPSLFWSAVCLSPISFFCYNQMSLSVFYLFSGISLLAVLLPNSFYDSIQLSQSTSFYKKIGVKLVNKFTQDGDLINSLMRRKIPHYKTIYSKNSSVKKLVNQTYVFEKFHFSFFVFFTLTAIYAFIKNKFHWAIVLSVLNVIFNVYPNLLQQYIRIKLRLFNQRKSR